MNKIAVIMTFVAWSAMSGYAETVASAPTERARGDSLKPVPQNGPAQPASGVQSSKAADTAKTSARTDTAASPVVAVKTGFARLRIQSQPDSAAIVIDSIERGRTPAQFDSLSPGTHIILVKKKGYFVKKITTTLSPDSLHDISVLLVKPGCLVVKSEPAGAALYLDNKEAGTTPYENTKIKSGAYALKLERQNHERVERSITVTGNACDTISISLPISKAYTDSVERSRKVSAEKNRRFKKTIDLIAIGAFLAFGAVIFLIEAANAD